MLVTQERMRWILFDLTIIQRQKVNYSYRYVPQWGGVSALAYLYHYWLSGYGQPSQIQNKEKHNLLIYKIISTVREH